MAKYRIPERVRGTPRPSRLAHTRAHTHTECTHTRAHARTQCTTHLGLSTSGRRSLNAGSFGDLLGCVTRSPGPKIGPGQGLQLCWVWRTTSLPPPSHPSRGAGGRDKLPPHAHPHPPLQTRAGGAPFSDSGRESPAFPAPHRPPTTRRLPNPGRGETLQGFSSPLTTVWRPGTLWLRERTDLGRKNWSGLLSQTPQSFVLGSERLFWASPRSRSRPSPRHTRNVSTHFQRLFTRLSVLPWRGCWLNLCEDEIAPHPDQNSKRLALGRRRGGRRCAGSPELRAQRLSSLGWAVSAGSQGHLSVSRGAGKEGLLRRLRLPLPPRGRREVLSLIHCTLGFSRLCCLRLGGAGQGVAGGGRCLGFGDKSPRSCVSSSAVRRAQGSDLAHTALSSAAPGWGGWWEGMALQ